MRPEKISSPFGGFIRDVDRFDAEFFGISPREAESMDPQHRLLLETAWHALEHANIPASQLRGTDTGVFVGICTYDYAIRHLAGGSDCGTAYFGTGNALSAAAGRLSYLFGFNGPSLSVDTACSSSLVSVHLACQALRSGECRLSLAAGVNLILTPQTSISFSRAHMLAPDGRCKPFDAAANGYVRGEGCGVIVLKLLEDAQRDRDPILAVIRGSAVNQDGASSGLTVPSGPAQQDVIGKALANARLRQADIGYVEAHGTGTPLGDPIEARSLAAAYCSERELASPLWVGSVKSNIGHLEGAAGIASLIKAALAVQHGVIPPSLHFTSPNPNIEWLFSGLRIPTEAHPWPTGAKRVAGISSFGFTGTNAHVIVEEPPAVSDVASTTTEASEPIVLPISGTRSGRAGAADSRSIAQLLATAPSFADVAAVAALGREHFKYRRAVVAESSSSAAELLRRESKPPQHPAGSLAARYEAGGEVDWKAQFDPAARTRVRVPVYPFLGGTHWLTERIETTPGDPGRALETEVVLHAAELLVDHQVFGRVLVPAAALIEMILSAGRKACRTDRLVLEDFVIHRPLALTGDATRSVRIALEPRTDGFHATIAAVDSRRPHELIAEAHVRAAIDHAVPDDATGDQPQEGEEPSIPSMYAAWRERGLNYGPAFRTVLRLRREGARAHAEIGWRGARQDETGYYIHPALLDGCLQAAAASYPEPPTGQLCASRWCSPNHHVRARVVDHSMRGIACSCRCAARRKRSARASRGWNAARDRRRPHVACRPGPEPRCRAATRSAAAPGAAVGPKSVEFILARTDGFATRCREAELAERCHARRPGDHSSRRDLSLVYGRTRRSGAAIDFAGPPSARRGAFDSTDATACRYAGRAFSRWAGVESGARRRIGPRPLGPAGMAGVVGRLHRC